MTSPKGMYRKVCIGACVAVFRSGMILVCQNLFNSVGTLTSYLIVGSWGQENALRTGVTRGRSSSCFKAQELPPLLYQPLRRNFTRTNIY